MPWGCDDSLTAMLGRVFGGPKGFVILHLDTVNGRKQDCARGQVLTFNNRRPLWTLVSPSRRPRLTLVGLESCTVGHQRVQNVPPLIVFYITKEA